MEASLCFGCLKDDNLPKWFPNILVDYGGNVAVAIGNLPFWERLDKAAFWSYVTYNDIS